MINPRKAPYHGQIFAVIFLILPSFLLTLMFYGVISLWQPRFGTEINFASAKMFGCGLGAVFHFGCWLMGAFKENFDVVKNRVKEFFLDLFISPGLAFRGYWDDIKTNGIAYWIDFSIIVLNIWLFIDAIRDFMILRGFIN